MHLMCKCIGNMHPLQQRTAVLLSLNGSDTSAELSDHIYAARVFIHAGGNQQGTKDINTHNNSCTPFHLHSLQLKDIDDSIKKVLKSFF